MDAIVIPIARWGSQSPQAQFEQLEAVSLNSPELSPGLLNTSFIESRKVNTEDDLSSEDCSNCDSGSTNSSLMKWVAGGIAGLGSLVVNKAAGDLLWGASVFDPVFAGTVLAGSLLVGALASKLFLRK